MTKFKVREDANKSPDTMGDTYEFIKLDLDAFIAFVDAMPDDAKINRDTGPTEMFLNETRPGFHWSVVPGRIYFTSDAPYRDDQKEILTEDRVIILDPHPNCFSETQKWVNKIEDAVMNHPEQNLTKAEVRALIKKFVGK